MVSAYRRRDARFRLAGLLAMALVGSLLVAAVPALAASSSASAWGDNEHRQLGNGTTGEGSDSPVVVSGLSEVATVAAGDEHSMALLGSGTVMTWGSNSHAQLGDGTMMNSDMPVEVTGLIEVSAISAGGYHSLALLRNGTITAWGGNYFGQLGNGSETDSDVPVQVSGLSGVKSVSAGGAHSLALLGNGTVMAWGWNGFGQLGDGAFANSDVPVDVSGLSEVAAVSAGEAHSLALLKDGKVMAWGDNEDGDLGDGSETSSDVPVAVSGLSEVTAIAAGGSQSLALLNDGKVMAWGNDEYGQLGDGSKEQSSEVPVEVKGLSEVKAIAAGGSHSLALLTNGKVMAWGDNEYGQLGDDRQGRSSSSDVPMEVAGLSEVTAIAAGHLHSLAAGPPPKPFPTVTGVEPGYGAPAGGSHVTITGTNFNEVTAVKFGSSDAVSFKVESETEITAVSPAGAGTVQVTVTTAKAGDSPIGPSNEFDYRPAVTNLEPAYGTPAGGSHVTITGTNFNEVSAIKFGSSNATSFNVESETKITAVAPAGTGTVEVTVTTPGGTSSTGSGDTFNYGPSIGKLEPNYGSPAGGTHVTITGTNFNEVSAVKFGSTAATSFKVESETTITAVAPAGAGVVEVTVTTSGGTSATGFHGGTVPAEFSYAPVITGVTPGHGAPAGGTEVTITGANFSGATSVGFGANDAASFKVESDTKIVAVTPAFSGGPEDGVGVYVTTPGGTNTSEECGYPVGYRYQPTITKVEPSSGPAAGGTHVTIHGAAFEGTRAGGGDLCSLLQSVVLNVKFGSKPATDLNVVSDTEITAVAPAGAGTVDVTTESLVGPSPIISADQFSYAPTVTNVEPTVTNVEPNYGPSSGGTQVTIMGAAFKEVTAVKFGSASAASFKVESDSEITAVSPAGTGTVNMTVSTAKGTSPISSTDEFSYEAPAIEEVSPINGGNGQSGTSGTVKKQEEAAAVVVAGKVSLDGSTVTVRGDGEALVKLACTGTGTCSGKLSLTGKIALKNGKRTRTKTEILGTAGFSIPPGKTANVNLALNGTGRTLLNAAHGHLSASLTILKSSPAPAQTHIETVHLMREKSRSKAKK